MSGNPIDFSLDEQDYILRHIGPGPAHQSWGDIARNLNRLYREHNRGTRARNSIWRWVKNFTENYPQSALKSVKAARICVT